MSCGSLDTPLINLTRRNYAQLVITGGIFLVFVMLLVLYQRKDTDVVPDYLMMSESEIELYVRERILASRQLRVVILAPGKGGGGTVKIEHVISDFDSIQRLARSFDIKEKKGTISAIGPSWYIILHCEGNRDWAFFLHGEHAFLPIEGGHFMVRIDLEFSQELAAPAYSLIELWRANRSGT